MKDERTIKVKVWYCWHKHAFKVAVPVGQTCPYGCGPRTNKPDEYATRYGQKP